MPRSVFTEMDECQGIRHTVSSSSEGLGVVSPFHLGKGVLQVWEAVLSSAIYSTHFSFSHRPRYPV